MGRIPLPPGFKAAEPAQPEKRDPPAARKGVGRDDINWILKTTLIPEHREDPNVVGFIKEYVLCRDVAQASRAVGLKYNQGMAIKRRADVHEAIAQITSLSILEHDLDASEIVERVKEIMNIDPAIVEDENGKFITSLRQLPPEARRAIKYLKVKNTYDKDPNGMQFKNGEIIEIEFWDKLKGVELLGREKNLFKETKVMKHDITENMGSLLLESQKRAAEARAQLSAPEPRDVIDVTPMEGKDDSNKSGV